MFPDTVSKTLSDAVIAQAQKLSAEERQMLVISYVPKSQQVWLIQGSEGFVMLEDKGETRLPIFPHYDLALAWLNENEIDARCVEVALDEFTATWLPGLDKNSVELVMFPSSADSQNLVMSASELAQEWSSDTASSDA